ncbi:hypothetical protein [Bacillus haynesii]|uniref:hypothetical protein n=1 Tax=Bacillus haynesii TaxID=1925021 RepID=UPI002280A32A|nr:hypothetical protein [Bacillus haynesii]MCY7860539.1 hypothetical protein [Bacillus haynesii]MCY8342699.1 hypothetical protein [Bacillus haynesii]MCY9150418.1 hypothetical protein [Bacillus haynesii]
MEQIFLSKYAKRIFFFVVSILFILLLLIRLLVVPALGRFLNETYTIIINTILDALLSTGVSTVVIASLAFWLTPKVIKKSHMDIIEPREIKDYLEKARETNEYWFCGGTGRFTRSKTIPKLAVDARNSNFSKKIYLILINPTNNTVCENYVEYRNKIRSGKKHNWDIKKLKKEIYATIVSAYTWNVEQPLLEVKIGLVNHYSLFRVDLSTQLAIITKEDPSEPALMCQKGTFFLKSYLENLRLSMSQGELLDNKVKGIPFSDLNGERIKIFLEELGFHENELSDSDFNEIVEFVKKGDNPYGY